MGDGFVLYGEGENRYVLRLLLLYLHVDEGADNLDFTSWCRRADLASGGRDRLGIGLSNLRSKESCGFIFRMILFLLFGSR